MMSLQKVLVAVVTAWFLTPCAAEKDAGSQVQVPLSEAPDMAAPLQLDETTDPPPAEEQSATSILSTIVKVVKDELSIPEHQVAISTVSFVIGALLIVNGEFCFKGILVGAIFLGVWLTTLNEVSVLIGVEKRHLRQIAGIEAGLVCAFAAMRGIDGIMLGAGAWIGAGAAHALENSLVHFGATAFHHNQVLRLAWYSAFIVIGVAGVGLKKHQRVLALITPIMGGPLVVSSLSWSDTPEPGFWMDHFRFLFVPDAPDVGPFADHDPVPLLGTSQMVRVDKMLGCIFWFFLFIGGVAFQLTALKNAAAKGKAKVGPDGLAALKEPLTATA